MREQIRCRVFTLQRFPLPPPTSPPPPPLPLIQPVNFLSFTSVGRVVRSLILLRDRIFYSFARQASSLLPSPLFILAFEFPSAWFGLRFEDANTRKMCTSHEAIIIGHRDKSELETFVVRLSKVGRRSKKSFDSIINVRCALGIGHWALGIGHWTLGIGHWAWACCLVGLRDNDRRVRPSTVSLFASSYAL